MVEGLQALVAEHNLQDTVDLRGAFCMGKCAEGVNVTVDDVRFSVSPDTVSEFFEKEILSKV